MPTVIICSNVYPPHFVGGAELIAHQQAKALQRRGHSVVIFAGDASGCAARYTVRRDEYDGLPVFRVSLTSEDFSPQFANFSHPAVDSHFESLLDKVRPDVVHMHNIMGLSTGLIHAAKARGIKTVITLHDHWGFCLKNTLILPNNDICNDYTQCARCMPAIDEGRQRNIPIALRQNFLDLQFAEVDTFISPSQYLAETYVRAGFPIRKLEVIWNGVNVQRFARVRKKPSPRVRFTVIGHFGFHKGIDVLITAVTRLAFRDRIAVNLVGAGELEQHLRQRVSALGLENIVRFWGKIDNAHIESVFEETDVLVLSSVWPENQPVSITEAMATGTPVVASRIGGIPELVTDGFNGYLFTPGSADDLAAKMSELVLHPERIAAFGRNGLTVIQTKTTERQVDLVCQIYEQRVA